MAKRYREMAESRNPNSESVNQSIPSEDESIPPDIKNWFSSYLYESPQGQLECFDSEALPIDKAQEKIQVPSSSSFLPSPSDLSEPPDIRNWFSSYVYESPVLDIDDESNCCIDGNGRTENVGVDFKKRNQLGTEGIPDNSLDKGQSFTKVSDDKSFGSKLMKSNNPAPLEENIISCINDGEYIQKSKSSFSSPDRSLDSKGYKEEDTKGKSCTKEADFISNVDSEMGKKSFSEIPLSSNDDGNKENESVANGFISTKKNKYTKENDRNFLKTCQRNHTEFVRKPDLKLPLNERHIGVVGRPLQEKTNLEHKAAVPETTGKWRCPQRSKPDLGPPLKQLRLEQWVRRVQ